MNNIRGWGGRGLCYVALSLPEYNDLYKEPMVRYDKAMFRIRIRIHFGRLDPDPHWEYGSGSRKAKMNREENSSFEELEFYFEG